MLDKVISHYKILEKLGEGGMGVVYKAEDIKLERMVALKFLPLSFSSDGEAKKRFIYEAQSASALDHPNICTIYEIADADDGQLFIAMAYYEGEILKSKIEKGIIDSEEAVKLTIQIAEGLKAAHEKGIIHRDIKPANIFVTKNGIVKILDFGLAKTSNRTKLTQLGSTVGTCNYMSPEQARGEEVDQRTDIWAFGVVMYEMLTGKLPFNSDYDQAVIYSILNEEPEPLSTYKKKIPERLQQIVEKALNKDVEKRYQCADEMIAELQTLSEEIKAGVAKQRLIRFRIPKKKHVYVYGIIALLFAAIALLWLFLSSSTGMKINSLAVLPLANLSGNQEQEYFVDGMTDELITNLAQIKALKVISRTSVMQYKGTKKPLPEIARELNVDAVIEGSVLREGSKVRITAQLIQASTDKHIWAESYQRDLRNVLALQDEIASTIAEKVSAALTPIERTLLSSAQPINPEAYDDYLKGMQYWYRLTPQDIVSALEYFELALKKDPNYAQAYVGIALVWIGRQQMGYSPPYTAAPKAKTAILKAIALDDKLAEAHSSLAIINAFYDWDWTGANAEFKKAIDLNPNFADARAIYSHYLMITKHPQEAMSQIHRAIELDPLNPFYVAFYGVDLGLASRYDEAIKQFRNSLKAFPDLPVAHFMLAATLYMKGEYEESLTETKVYYSGDREIENALVQGYTQSGYRGAMKNAANALAARYRNAYLNPTDIAYLYAHAGEKAKTLEWLEKGLEVRDPNLPYINADPLFDPLRNTPHFQELLGKMKLIE